MAATKTSKPAGPEDWPLSAPQREIWLDQLLHPGAPIYNIGGYVLIRGFVDPPAFRRALGRVVEIHQALRLRLRLSEPLATQWVAPTVPEVPLVDLARITDADRQARRLMDREMTRLFSLDGGPVTAIRAHPGG